MGGYLTLLKGLRGAIFCHIMVRAVRTFVLNVDTLLARGKARRDLIIGPKILCGACSDLKDSLKPFWK